ncbi:mediator of RNA polymerase II transcription subunit 15 [Pararge aegeria]|uniref:Jg24412 protein n=1 Tax=Pararge aegeria aegeria TaxID=348720 RepID=A0A8S4SMR8_9NEOP|nr:mediator of RNA polymerase II transcription subunit 15 [Pararge aegeria]CAH2266447.1 jg24412 [Pararge aegeria aegeria]
MFVIKTLLLCAVCALASAQNRPNTTPVPILKQINKQNDDGSYSYGYEAADGSFKIETKYPNGDVAGKYGYVDVDGKVREVSYGASSQRGFEPEGTGIMVPPPTLHDPASNNALTDGQEDDGQYREDPRIYEDPKYNGRKAKPSSFRYEQPQQQQFSFSSQPKKYQEPQAYQPQPQYQARQQYQPQPQYEPQPQYQPQQPAYQQQTSLFSQSPQQFTPEFKPQSQVYHQQPQFSYQSYTPQPYQNNQYQNNQRQNYQHQNHNPFAGHPAQNFDPSTGSYSIDFTGK